MNGYNTLIELLRAQKRRYERMLDISARLGDQLGVEPADLKKITPLFEEREKLLGELQVSDGEIAESLNVKQRDEWLERDEAAALRLDMIDLVKKVMEADGHNISVIKKAQDSAQGELSSLFKGKKTVGGYGAAKKAVYAKFIDLKQ